MSYQDTNEWTVSVAYTSYTFSSQKGRLSVLLHFYYNNYISLNKLLCLSMLMIAVPGVARGLMVTIVRRQQYTLSTTSFLHVSVSKLETQQRQSIQRSVNKSFGFDSQIFFLFIGDHWSCPEVDFPGRQLFTAANCLQHPDHMGFLLLFGEHGLSHGDIETGCQDP